MTDEIRDKVKELKLEVFSSQSEIIQLQKEALDGAISLLIQHADVDEAELAPIKEKIDRAALIRAELN